MPQASDEVRAYWNGSDEQPAIEHLLARGYQIVEGVIHKPAGEVATERDLMAIALLCDEWDFGYAG